MNFTPEQQAVIDARDCSLLVSAAAGSGKTAVLVQRILERITGPEQLDVDTLLVVTFTRAAAAEMKDRLRKAIGALCLAHPDDRHLRTALHLHHLCDEVTGHSCYLRHGALLGQLQHFGAFMGGVCPSGGADTDHASYRHFAPVGQCYRCFGISQ